MRRLRKGIEAAMVALCHHSLDEREIKIINRWRAGAGMALDNIADALVRGEDPQEVAAAARLAAFASRNPDRGPYEADHVVRRYFAKVQEG